MKKKLTDSWNSAAEILEVDAMRFVRYGKIFRYLRSVDGKMRFLEVGCGEGTGLMLALQLGLKNIVGAEVSPQRLIRTKEKVGERIPLFQISPENRLPFQDESFDVVISAAVIEHTLDPRGFIREIERVVSPGGYIVISSDCWQWRILQLLGIYRSVQPIDKAPFPLTLLKYFAENNLKAIHYEGFPLPGQAFRFFRMIANSACRYMNKLRIFVKLRNFMLKERGGHQKHDGNEQFHQYLEETWSDKQQLWRFITLIFSDENVFFLRKPE